MRIVHFAVTPLAGAPLRMVQAINAHTGHSARLIDLCRYGTEDFGQDVVFAEQPELAIELAEQADIIHFHNYLDMDSPHFAPIRFRALAAGGTLFIRHFHSHPELVAGRMGISPQTLLAQPIPSLVIAQFQERYYPRSRVVPNFVPETHPAYLPFAAGETQHTPRFHVFCSPTNLRGAWDCRWNTKAAPQMLEIITQVCRQTGGTWALAHKTPLMRTLALKRDSRVVADDMVTGSYHLTGLEGLSQGKPVLTHLDDRTRRVFEHFSGTAEVPFVNIRLEDAAPVLRHLLTHPEEAEEVGAAGRAFMENRWSCARMVRHLDEAYTLLAHNPDLVVRQKELALEGARRFFALALPDLLHGERMVQQRAQVRLSREAEREVLARDTTETGTAGTDTDTAYPPIQQERP